MITAVLITGSFGPVCSMSSVTAVDEKRLSHGPGALLQTWRGLSEERSPRLMKTACVQSELSRAPVTNTGNAKSVCFTISLPRKGPAVNGEFTPFIRGNTMHITLTYNNWDSHKVTILYLLKSVTSS